MEFLEIKEVLYNKHQERKSIYWEKVGIYAIKLNKEIVYIGKSTNLFHRFISHEINTIWPGSKEYNSAKYCQMREAIARGYTLEFEVLEYCTKEELSQKEDKWIGQYLPKLNTSIPYQGRHTNKKVESLF